MRRAFFTAVALLLVGWPAVAHCDDSPAKNAKAVGKTFNAAQIEFFEKHVRPVLTTHCFECHGPKKQESGLRLDSRRSVLKGGESGSVVTSGNADESLLIEAVLYQDGLEMPPDEKLPPEAIVALKKWIQMGLPWPRTKQGETDDAHAAWKTHWAFRPVQDPEVPRVKNVDWPRNSIDNFVLAKLEAADIEPSPEANRKTLIRRAAFDLIGLPPTPAEVAEFEYDTSGNAYERVIDRLLASPHYGERWGRLWLDVARYADNKGYVFFEGKKFPWAYTYRDYVVRALNDDIPYNRFVLEQLAADQLDLGEDKHALAAMGFLTLGGRFMNNMHDVLDDRIDVVSRGLLGLTVTCARCHDHKYDPIPQDDYYALYGVFRSSSEPLLPPLFSPPPDNDEYRKFDAEMKAREKKINDFVTEKHAELVSSARTRADEYLMSAYAKRNQPPTEEFMLLAEKGGLNPMMELRWQVTLENSRRNHHPVWIPWHRYADLDEAEFAAQAPTVTAALAKNDQGSHRVNPYLLKTILEKSPTSMNDVARCYSDLLNNIDGEWNETATRAQQTGASIPVKLTDPDQEQLRKIFYGPNAPPDIPSATGWGFLSLLPDRPAQEEFKKLIKEVETWSVTGPGAPPRAMVLVDEPNPYNPRIFMRGNPHRLGRPVQRRFLSVFDQEQKPFDNGSGRLELAESIASADNPLTARVIVNRIWLHHFGEGLVETPSDFGVRSPAPSHPLLLDHLAGQFMKSDWSIKRMHRSMMLSAVYRQQSGSTLAIPTTDATNRLLWKMNRRRLDFESTRDALLAAAGSLDETMGGPPVDLLGKKFVARRTIYGFINRMDLPGLFRSFDFPDPAATSPKRDSTTVAPQALYFMNNQFVVEIGRNLANRPELTTLANTNQRVEMIYHILYGRSPTKIEYSISQQFLGNEPTATQWSNYAQALVMTNEFVFID